MRTPLRHDRTGMFSVSFPIGRVARHAAVALCGIAVALALSGWVPSSLSSEGVAPAPAPLSQSDLSSLGTLAFGFAAVLLPALALGALFVLAGYVVWSLALMSLFRKVGVPIWKAWVPYVQTWTLLRLGGQNGNWVWLTFVPYGNIVTAVFLYIGMHRIGIAFGKDSGMLVLGILLPFVWAFQLGGKNEFYQPQLLAWRGYPPPLEGYGAVPTA